MKKKDCIVKAIPLPFKAEMCSIKLFNDIQLFQRSIALGKNDILPSLYPLINSYILRLHQMQRKYANKVCFYPQKRFCHMMCIKTNKLSDTNIWLVAQCARALPISLVQLC